MILGGLFVMETMSVILQVISFRGFGRRIFRMSPVHHHFELLGWPEFTVIVRLDHRRSVRGGRARPVLRGLHPPRGPRVSGRFADERAVVVGAGVAGASAARVLVAEGATVRVTDARPEPELAAASALRADGVEVLAGGHDPPTSRALPSS